MFAIEVILQILYILFGCIGTFCNIFVTCVIVKCKELHFNAYYLAAALAMTDVIDGMAFICTGAYQLYIVLYNQTGDMITPFECAFIPSTHLFIIGYHATSMMVLLIACDRFLSISAVQFYSKLGKRYTAAMISFGSLYALGAWAYFTYDMMVVMPHEATTTKFCYDIYSESVHLYDYYSTPSFVTGAVIIMIITIILLWKRGGFKTTATSNQSVSTTRNTKACRLLAFISFNTFLMWVIPQMVVAIVDAYSYGDQTFAQYAQLFWLLQPLHGFTNMFIYFRKGGQVRKAYNDMRNKISTGTVSIVSQSQRQ